MKSIIATLFCFAALCLARSAPAEQLSKEFDFEKPSVNTVSKVGVYLDIPGCRRAVEAGKPAIPVFSACFILPAGETVASVRFEAISVADMKGKHAILPAPAQTPTNRHSSAAKFRDKSIYSMNELYPAAWGDFASEQSVSGIKLVFLKIYPCRMIPSSGTVSYARRIRAVLETKPVRREHDHPPGAVNRAAGWAGKISENPSELADYTIRITEPGIYSGTSYSGQECYPYVIITADDLEDSFLQLAELKEDMGLRTRIVTTGWIQDNFSGADIQESIRSFIIHAYFNWETEYVLLGGDENIIPHRGMYVKAGSEIEPDIPSDLYYCCLDGSWNTDGDAYFGEPGEEDLLPEVKLGRLPADTAEEVDNFTTKLTAYSSQPIPADCAEAAFLGELLWSEDGVDTWGGDYKDETISGSENYGFSTAGISGNFTAHILYDREIPPGWNKFELISILNSGVNLVNHLGHTGLHNAMRLTGDDLQLLTNDGTSAGPAVIYSQGCYAAAFDNRDYAGQIYQEDAIGEQFVTSEAGAVAFIGNSRYGWNAPGSTCGVSQFFDRQFVDAIFGEGITAIGDALDDSRIDNIPFISYPLIRYVMYGMTLLGDPAMNIWTAQPAGMALICDEDVKPGYNTISIEVISGSAPVKNALVSLYNPDYSLYWTKRSDSGGLAVFSGEFPDEGMIQVRAVSPEHLPCADSIPINSSPDTLIELGTVLIDDDSLGGSLGDGDGIIENGELVQIGAILSNNGNSYADSCYLNLNCGDPYISVRDSMGNYFSMPKRSTLILEDEFRIFLSPGTPDSHSAELLFRINTPAGNWDSRHSITVNSPGIELDSWVASDSLCGDGNGCVEPWDFVALNTLWKNTGNSETDSITLFMSTYDDRYCRVYQPETSIPPIQAGETAYLSGDLSFFVKPFSPPFSRLPLVLSLIQNEAVIQRESLLVTTCGYTLEDSCDSTSFWTGKRIVGVNGWHISSQSAHSPPSSWKCGGRNGEVYPNMMNTALESPPLCLGENSTLTFWHRISAEAGSSYPYWAEDAGVVEISTDGGDSWTIISPTYNYPCRASSGNTIFLDPYQRCYSGESGWEFQEFDLSSYQGPVIIRFHFASNEQYGFDGWYLDDIEIYTERYTDTDNPDFLVNRLIKAYPNPFNPVTNIQFETARRSHVSLRIYDVRGRLIRTLLDRTVDRGSHEYSWHGKNSRGQALSSGVYLCSLRIGSYHATQRLVLLR